MPILNCDCIVMITNYIFIAHLQKTAACVKSPFLCDYLRCCMNCNDIHWFDPLLLNAGLMLPDCKPIDLDYFSSTQDGFIGSVYGDGSTGLIFSPPFRIHMGTHLNRGDRQFILNEMRQKYTAEYLYLDRITQTEYVDNEKLLEYQSRLYYPLYNRLYLSYNNLEFHSDSICSSTVYDIQVQKETLFARLMSSVVYFPISDPKKVRYTNQSSLLLDVLPDEIYDTLYLGINNYYLKIFDLEHNKKIRSFAFKTCSSDIPLPYKWCCIQPGTWQFEKYFVNEKYIYLVDIRENQANALVNLKHLKYFGFKKCSDMNYVSLDSDSVNLYDTRMISTPLLSRNHEIRNMAPRLYDVSMAKNILSVLVGSFSYPSLRVIEFEESNKWHVNYNIKESDVYPFDGDHFAYWDNKDTSHLKLLSATYKNKEDIILVYNDGTQCNAKMNRKETECSKLPVCYSSKLKYEEVVEESLILNDTNIVGSLKSDEFDTDYKKALPLKFFKNDRIRKLLSKRLENDSTDLETLPWDTVEMPSEMALIISYPDNPNKMVWKFAQRFKQMMAQNESCYSTLINFQETGFSTNLPSIVNTSAFKLQKPVKKKKKRKLV
eukprot:NODE_150_length_17275_cov_0.559618.p1 type:complete len:602 gc:universal NODE_150_length_17275_cov_0.559618:4451-6256(+)